MAKEFFKDKGVQYSEVDLTADAAKREEMRGKMEAMGQGLAVPIIEIDGNLTLGFDRKYLESTLGIAA
jgi:glutaredoxin